MTTQTRYARLFSTALTLSAVSCADVTDGDTSAGQVSATGQLVGVALPEIEVPAGAFAGAVLMNRTEHVAGRLVIGLLDDPSATTMLSSVEQEASFPAHFEFQALDDGKYWVVAFLDVGAPNEWTAPGAGDRVEITQHDVFIFRELPPPPAIYVGL